MKQVPLTQGYFALVDDKDYKRVMQYKWYAKLQHKTIYAARNAGVRLVKRVTVRLHRFILGLTNPKIQVDHEDRNGLNCQRYNLRVANHKESMRNRGVRVDSASGFKGVNWRKDRCVWRAFISVNNKRLSLGQFVSAKEAAQAYDVAALKHFGEFASTNF